MKFILIHLYTYSQHIFENVYKYVTVCFYMSTVHIYSFGHMFDIQWEPREDDFYIDVRELKKYKTCLDTNKLGTDKTMQRKYLQHPEIKEFYEHNILFPARENMPSRIYIGCHQGKHKSVMLAIQLANDLKRRYKKVVLQHLTISLD